MNPIRVLRILSRYLIRIISVGMILASGYHILYRSHPDVPYGRFPWESVLGVSILLLLM